MVLLRRVIGDTLRARRQAQQRTLREVSTAANVSLGYLSEVERGQKEASSELLAAICDALGAQLSDVLREVSHSVAVEERVDDLLAPVREPLPVGDRAVVGEKAFAGDKAAAGRRVPAGRGAAAAPEGVAGRGVPADRPAVPAGRAGAGAGRIVPPGHVVRGGQIVPVRQMHTVPASALRPATKPAERPVDGEVSVTVRRESPLKTTLVARRRSRERDVVHAS